MSSIEDLWAIAEKDGPGGSGAGKRGPSCRSLRQHGPQRAAGAPLGHRRRTARPSITGRGRGHIAACVTTGGGPSGSG